MKTATAAALDVEWLRQLGESVPVYLGRLRIGPQPGRHLPCERGATPVGREMALGFSCFALKTLHMLGRWTERSESDRTAWLDFIRSYQHAADDECAFVDPPEINFLTIGRSWRDRLASMLGQRRPKDFAQSIVLAETKQAIATLAEVGAQPRVPFRGFPLTPEGVRSCFEAKDWSRPWGAGGQCAGLVVFIKTQAPALLAARDVDELLEVCREFYAGLVDAESGAYFRGRRPAHGELVNGAMKVLMALDWLDEPVHCPERLVQTCLAQPPSPDGCHLVDAIYVLHQSLRGEATATVRAYCMHVAEMIRRHANPDGGLSFYVGRAQMNYYGVPISRGLPESDVQGTCLLTWALAMIWKMLAPETAAWTPMRP